MMNMAFGEWLPDQPDNVSGVTVAKNVIPAARGYRGLQDLSQYSNAADGRIRGLFAAKDDSGDPKIFAGDGSKLYEFTKSNSNLSPDKLCSCKCFSTICGKLAEDSPLKSILM